ncbi:hypothetical protein GA0115242_10321 [Streptomyces sp. SolWspMP-5a-2]|nr:hypothetical protein GA0115242_10321 [Streptomyces sp. SolWspMP-5a-2]
MALVSRGPLYAVAARWSGGAERAERADGVDAWCARGAAALGAVRGVETGAVGARVAGAGAVRAGVAGTGAVRAGAVDSAPGQRAATTGRAAGRGTAAGAVPSGLRVLRASGRAANSARVAEDAGEPVAVRGCGLIAVEAAGVAAGYTDLATTSGTGADGPPGDGRTESEASVRKPPGRVPSVPEPPDWEPSDRAPSDRVPPVRAPLWVGVVGPGSWSFGPAGVGPAWSGAAAGAGSTSGVATPFAGSAETVGAGVAPVAGARWTSAVPSSGAVPGVRSAAPPGGADVVAGVRSWRTGACGTSGPGAAPEARGTAGAGSWALGGSAGSGAPRPPRARAPDAWDRCGGPGLAVGAVAAVTSVPLSPVPASSARR